MTRATLRPVLAALVVALAAGFAVPAGDAAAAERQATGQSAQGARRAKAPARARAAVRDDRAPARDRAGTTATSSEFPADPAVHEFVRTMVERHGFEATPLLTMFTGVRCVDATLRLIAPTPPAKRSWANYRQRTLVPIRINEGLRFWQDNDAALERAAIRYGVPPSIIVSIIGVETIYGRNSGDFRVIDTLSTLAFGYPRRADYFREELEHYLLYTREAGVDPFELRGSYAGAIGMPQFMPGSIRRWAVDFDGDGRIDLRRNPVDAIGSVARFLAGHGWQPGGPMRYAATIDDVERVAPLIDAGIEPKWTPAELASYGVTSPDTIAADQRLALIDLPNADDPPSFYLGANNFYVITRYNRSSFYAMSVIELASTLESMRRPDDRQASAR